MSVQFKYSVVPVLYEYNYQLSFYKPCIIWYFDLVLSNHCSTYVNQISKIITEDHYQWNKLIWNII